MKDYVAANIRNIAVLGHGSEGKTTLVEALLYLTGVTDRQGRVEDGTTVTDFDPEETKRHISISAAIAPFEYKDVKINLIDVPGYFDFAGEASGALSAADGCVIVVGALSGAPVGAEKAWDACEKRGISKMFVVNQMDRENANFEKELKALNERFGSGVVAIQIPVIEGGQFKGIVDVLSGKAFTGSGKSRKEIPVPDSLKDELQLMRESLMEAAAGTDEALMEKFFEEGELSDEETVRGLNEGVKDGSITPVLCCSATTGFGVVALIDNFIGLLPSPAGEKHEGVNPKTGDTETRVCDKAQPFSAQVFKTLADPFVGKLSIFKVLSGELTAETALYNANAEKAEKAGTIYVLRGKKQTAVNSLTAGDIGALAKLQYTFTGHTLCEAGKPIKYPMIEFPEPCISMAVYAKKAGGEDKVFSGLAHLAEEDPTLRIAKSEYTTETLLSGMGELHLEVTSRKLQAKFGAEALLQDPKIPYRETIRKAIKVQGRHKKQTGGHGQFGDVWVEFEPIFDGSEEFEFVDKVVGGAVPRNFIPAVEKGLRENLTKGVLAGYPMVNLRASLVDGSYHPVDSSEMAFKTAARIAFKKLVDASPVLLEPVYHVEILVPEEYTGDIMGDMNKRRGRIMGMEQVDGLQKLVAEAPLAEMFKYATDLRSMTQARGSFTMKFERYEEVPAADAKKIIENAKLNLDEEDE